MSQKLAAEGAAEARVGRGRPTREQASQRHRELLDRAMEMFLERGFEHTTIRDVAAATNMTRRTVYARYADKRELFRAILEHAVREMIIPPKALAGIDGADLRQALIAVARLRIASTLTPAGLRLQRFLHTESYRFPDLISATYSRITGPTIAFIAELLERHNREGATDVADPTRAAATLMNMVVGVPVRMVLLGVEVGAEDIEDRIQFSVDLFLNGACRR